MSDEKGLLYVGTDYHTALYRNVTVALELAAAELADLAEEHEAADRAVRFIGDALKECWRIMHVNSPAVRATPASAPVGETREQLLNALKPFAEFARQWNRQPLSRIADEVYGIHGGTEYEAYLRLSDCRRALEVYDAARAAERRDQKEGR